MSNHSEHHHEPNGEDSIPRWVLMVGISLMIFTVFCFSVMLAGML